MISRCTVEYIEQRWVKIALRTNTTLFDWTIEKVPIGVFSMIFKKDEMLFVISDFKCEI